MFALALLLLAPTDPVVRATPARAERTVPRRAHRVAARPVAKPVRLNILAPCEINAARPGCRASENERYRLRDAPGEVAFDGKTHALDIDNKARECGVTGAPVCPQGGAQIVKIPLDPTD